MKIVNLKDSIISLESGKRPKGGAVKDGVPSLGGEHINSNGGFNLSDEKLKYVPKEYFESLSKGIIKKNDILLVKDGATTGKVAYVDEDFPLNKACINEHVFLLRTKGNLISKYLFYFLFSNVGQREILKDFRGATVGGISKEFIDINMYLPTLEEQEKIVNLLDSAKTIIDKRKEQIEALDELVKSQFIEMFGDLKVNSKQWNVLAFDEFAIIDTNMTKDFEKYSDYPHIGIDSIEKNTGNILEYQFVKDCSLKSGKYLFDERHIIYSKIRPNLNKVALPKFKGVCSADAYPILCIDEIVDRNYLGYVLRSEFFLNYILAFSGRTNIPKVNKEQLKGFNMPTPPIELQVKFADFVKQVDKLKFELENSLKELENNFNSLMQKAFKGQLFN